MIANSVILNKCQRPTSERLGFAQIAVADKMEPAGKHGLHEGEGEGPMATRLTPKKPEGEKTAAEKASSKTGAPSGPVASAQAEPATKSRKAPRSRKGTIVNAETAQVLRDAEAGKNLLHYPSLEAMFEDLGI
jgi:hypothetical protein